MSPWATCHRLFGAGWVNNQKETFFDGPALRGFGFAFTSGYLPPPLWGLGDLGTRCPGVRLCLHPRLPAAASSRLLYPCADYAISPRRLFEKADPSKNPMFTEVDASAKSQNREKGVFIILDLRHKESQILGYYRGVKVQYVYGLCALLCFSLLMRGYMAGQSPGRASACSRG